MESPFVEVLEIGGRRRSEWQDLGFPSLTRWMPQVLLFAVANRNHLRPPGPKPGALKTELHSERDGGPEGSFTLNPPADNGALC